MKVFISPYANDGILRVIEAQMEHLPKFGVDISLLPNDADIICNHGAVLIEQPGVPSVNCNHGLYWSRQPWDDGFMDVNAKVVESMRHAVAHTAPSEWVSRAIRRGGFWYPEVVYHGIDGGKFLPPSKHSNYVLWNKARQDYVSNPQDLMTVAAHLDKRQFYTTIGRADANVKVLGPQPHPMMKKLVSEAGVYLATARETFGIGTLEALAYGVPVAGWNWGGTAEIIIDGETGYLAPPGDFRALAECIEKCYAERDRLSANAVADVRTRWRWEPRIEQYANIFKRVYEKYRTPGPKVSVIVTAYKLDEFLPKCLDSILEQTFKDFECLVVDDAQSKYTEEIVRDYAQRDSRISYCPTPHNMGLPAARNFGLVHSKGQYIRHVDADDYMAENCMEIESDALDRDKGIDIVYGHLEVVRTDGSQFIQNGDVVRGGWPGQFNWYQQMAHMNQLPSCVMARREVYERSGGYRVRMDRNEDAEFWCRVTSLGFRAAKVTEAVTYYHRERHDSKGATEWAIEGAEKDWTGWFPWRMGSRNIGEAQKLINLRGESPRNSHIVPFGAQGTPPHGLRYWYVHDHAYPVVSIIVTCGPGHKKYLLDALDSIQAQNYPDWECVVVNDTGEKWEPEIMGAPWARVVNMDGNRGASEARNEGLRHINGKYVVWMDADDFWMPWFLDKMVNYAEYNDGVIYSDLFENEGPKQFKTLRYGEFQDHYWEIPMGMLYPGSSVLVPRKIAQAVVELQGGFDLNIPGMEDWDYQVAVHHLGFCAFRVPEPLFVYRKYSSTKRDADYAKIDSIVAYMDKKWSAYRKGEKTIVCGCNQTKNPIAPMPSSMLSSSGEFTRDSINSVVDPENKAQMVAVEYLGNVQAPFTVKSRMSQVLYRFANSDHHRVKSVFLGDAEWLASIMNGAGERQYRILHASPVEGANDPAAFLGQPIS